MKAATRQAETWERSVGIVDGLGIGLLFLTASGLLTYLPCRFMGGEQFGKIFALAIVAISLAARISYLEVYCLRWKLLPIWILWIIVWPICSMSIAAQIDVLEFYSRMLFCGYVLLLVHLVDRHGLQSIAKVIRAGLLTALCGVMLNYFAFDWFFQGVTLTQADVDFDWGVKRAWGFRLQPNYLASELCMMLPIALLVRQNMGTRIGLMVATALGVMLTGSRGGMIICVLVIAVTALNYIWSHPRSADFLKACLVWIPMLVLCLMIYITLFGLEGEISSLIERFAESLQMLSGGTETLAASSDDSLQARTLLHHQVMEAFWRKPLFGYGCGGMRILWEEGTLSKVTHNTFHYYMLDYGMLYLIGFALLLLSLIRKWWQLSIYSVVHQPLIWTFLAVTIVGGSCSMAVKSNAYAVFLATVLSVYLFAMGHFPHHRASWLGVK